MATSEEGEVSPKLYVATMGHIYPRCEDGKFYPAGMPDRERLKYYASKFNSILIKTTFFGQPKKETYQNWLQSVSDNPIFKFILSAPKAMSHAKNISELKKAWTFFWDGDDSRGGCNILVNKIGCILIEFPSSFYYSLKNINRLKTIMSIVPKDVRCAVEFRHFSWWENTRHLKLLFDIHPSWCIATPYVENGLVDYGWAGNLPSTRTIKNKEPIPDLITTKFTLFTFHGTMGRNIGSYDDHCFLERLVSKIKKYQADGINTIYCSFNNTESSYCYPLPGLLIMGFPLRPKIKELPLYADADLPCCLHDARRLERLWNEITECPYETNTEGNIEMTFS